MNIIKQKTSSFTDIKKIALLADPACRKGWENNFPRLLKYVWEKHKPELFIIAGDLSIYAQKNEYDKFIYYLNQIPSNWVSIAGDHDRPTKNFRNYFGSLHKTIDVGKWHFVGCNTSHRMFLKKDALWLDKNIKPNTIVFSHIPPEAEGWTFHSLWPKSSNRFLNIIRKHKKNIRLMFFGHIHGYSKRKFLNIPMLTIGGVAESKRIKNNRYNGKQPHQIVIFNVKNGTITTCRIP